MSQSGQCSPVEKRQGAAKAAALASPSPPLPARAAAPAPAPTPTPTPTPTPNPNPTHNPDDARVHIEATMTDLQRGLDGIAGSGGIHRRPAKAILNHLQSVAALFADARVALAGQQSLDLGLGKILGNGYGKGQEQWRIAAAAGELVQRCLDARRRIAPHR